MTDCIQLITAFLGSLGFAILFNNRGKRLWFSALGGFLAWGIYLLAGLFIDSDPLRYLIASAISALYAELMARLTHSPSTLYILPAVIPLVPGGSLYRTMEYGLNGDSAAFISTGFTTLLLAASISVGIILISTPFTAISSHIRKRH